MSDDEDIFLPLKLHDDRFQPYHDIPIRLATSIPVVEFVVIPAEKVFRVLVLSALSATISSGEMPTSISSYVMPSHTPASSSSSDFHVFFSNGRKEPVSIVRCSVDVHTCDDQRRLASAPSLREMSRYLTSRGP